MRRLILQRLMQLPFVLLGVTFLTFCLVNLLPGNIAVFVSGGYASPQQIKTIDQQLNLNHPFLVQYWNWIWAALHGNLGRSYTTHVPVTTEIKQVLPPTLELMIYAFLISLVLSVSLAFWSVWTRSRALDRFITTATLGAHCLPGFIIAIFGIYVFSVRLHWMPTIPYRSGQPIGQNLAYMFLPAFCVAIGLFPTQMRVFRGDLLDQLEREDYVSLAWLKGLSKAQVIFRHVVKNGASGFVTILGLQLGFLFAGIILIESVFTIDGAGDLLYNSIGTHDVTTVEGILLLVAVIVVVANLLADLLYLYLDPRVRIS